MLVAGHDRSGMRRRACGAGVFKRSGRQKGCAVCGILGAYNDDRCLAAMSDAIAHWGPDAAGT
jgi:hypothetical protein